MYGLLQLWQPAVQLALTFDVALAEQTAANDAIASTVRRQLWLLIAEHRIRRSAAADTVGEALHVLAKCGGLLRIEDVLAFFDDFDRIDQLRAAIIDTLRTSCDAVQRLRDEMTDAAGAAELVRGELQAFRQRSVRIAADAKCAVCRCMLMEAAFLAFQCGHMLHVRCMELERAKLAGGKLLGLTKLFGECGIYAGILCRRQAAYGRSTGRRMSVLWHVYDREH